MMHESCFEPDNPLSQVYTLGFSWLSSQLSRADAFSVKELAHLILLYSEKGEPENAKPLLDILLSRQKPDGNLGDIRDTARFVSVLFGIISKKQEFLSPFFRLENENEILNEIKAAANVSLSHLMSQKERWGDDIYDLVYILSALGDAGVFEPELCLDLCNDVSGRQHSGTTALIIAALQKQKNLSLFQGPEDALISEFIGKKIDWLVSVRENGCWKYPATSNLVLHAFILCGQKRKALDSLSWLASSQKENGSWENDVNTTALSLLTF